MMLTEQDLTDAMRSIYEMVGDNQMSRTIAVSKSTGMFIRQVWTVGQGSRALMKFAPSMTRKQAMRRVCAPSRMKMGSRFPKKRPLGMLEQLMKEMK